MDFPFLDPSDYDKFSIRCHPLIIKDDGSYPIKPQPCFFAPLSRETFDRYPVDLDYDGDEFTYNDTRGEFKDNDKMSKELANGNNPLRNAGF